MVYLLYCKKCDTFCLLHYIPLCYPSMGSLTWNVSEKHVDIWDKDYGVIINECLCCVSLSLLTLLSDWGLYCSRAAVCAFLLHFTTHGRVEARGGWDPCGLSQKFEICCQSTEASLPQLYTHSIFTATIIESVVINVLCFSHFFYIVCRFSEWSR